MLHLHLRADGVHAEAAHRQTSDLPREPLDPSGGTVPGSHPVLHVKLNDLADEVHPRQRAVRAHADESTGEVRFVVDARYWIAELPEGDQVHLTFSWPQAGLPETSHSLTLVRPGDGHR